MNSSAELKKSSRHQHMSRGAKEKITLQQGSHGLKLRDELKTEKLVNQSNRDIYYKTKQDRVHYKVRQDDDDRPVICPKSLQNHQKQRTNIETVQNDELVKYMSNLPCYLQRVERGQNLQEKALNFGVLDWGRLEKWKYSKKHIPVKSTRNDPSTSNDSSSFTTAGSSTSNDSSSFTTAGSSTLSGRSHRGSTIHQKKQSHPLLPNLNTNQNDGPNRIVKSTMGRDVQQTLTVPKNSLMGQQDLLRTDQYFCENYSGVKKEKKAKRKDSDPKIIPEMQSSSSGSKDYESSLCPKGKKKVPDGEPRRGAEQLQQLNFSLPNNPGPAKQKNVVPILPGDSLQNSSSRISRQAEFTLVDRRSTEADRKSFSDCLHSEEEVHLAYLNSDIPHSCPLPCRVEGSQESDMKLADSLCAQRPEVSSHSCCLNITPDDAPTGQSKYKGVGENKLSSSAVVEASDWLDQKASEVRKRLPNRRASISLGELSRSFSIKDGSTVPQLRPSYVTVKSGPVRSAACSDDSTGDKANANSRGKSSPLRRLLDPLLKPKAGNHSEPSLKKSMSSHRASKSSDGQLDSSTVQSLKGKFLSSCRPINSYDSCPSEKNLESMMHALVQVTVKNGLPLFTFVVDSATDVLIATLGKTSTTLKDSYSWVYTMYTVSEIKKKSGKWINQGTKGKGHGYASSVVGRIKVKTLSQCPMLTGHNVKDHFLVREFVLFGAELKQADQETLDFHPNSELAAIVVKVPKEDLEKFRNDDWENVENKDLSDMGLNSCMPEGRCLCNAGENLGSKDNAGTERVTSTVVILPGAVHSFPSTGVPSSLIDRWKSGGSCDCGGWDVGCKLRILTDQQSSENFILSKSSSTLDKFHLFIQGGTQEDKPFFSLAPFKKGIFSVDFHRSINLLQAFSLCIAVINNRKPYDPSELSDVFEGKGSQETISNEKERTKLHAEVEPARYVHFPPLSPVGRV